MDQKRKHLHDTHVHHSTFFHHPQHEMHIFHRMFTTVAMTCLFSWVVCHSHHKKNVRRSHRTKKNFAPQSCSCWRRCWPILGPCWLLFRTVDLKTQQMIHRHVDGHFDVSFIFSSPWFDQNMKKHRSTFRHPLQR